MISLYYILYVITLSVIKKSAKILVGKNKKSAKKLVTWTKFSHFQPTKFSNLVTFCLIKLALTEKKRQREGDQQNKNRKIVKWPGMALKSASLAKKKLAKMLSKKKSAKKVGR